MGVLTDPTGSFTLDVPGEWARETEDCVTTLYSPRGIGTAFVTVARHARGPQPDFGGAAFLARFLRSLGLEVDDADIASAAGPGCRIFSHARDTARARWRFFSITDEETALLFSYTCPADADARLSGEELGEVDGMVRSVRLFHATSVH
ncbi:MAG TPA: hypothetical protein VII13_08350 [Vicinamibacteria bacterium]